MDERDNDLRFLIDLARGRFSRRDALKASGALAAGAALGGGVSIRQLANVSAQDAEPVGEVVWALDAPPPNLIPYGAVSQAAWNGREFFYDSLVMWDQDLNPIPGLAESWEPDESGSYIFHLRKGVKFHNGNEMTAADVKYSMDMAIAPPEPGVAIAVLANITGTDIVDDYTVKINTATVDPTLVGNLAWGRYTAIVPENFYDTSNALSEAVGTGPMKLVEYVQDDVVVMEAFPDFWGDGIPCINKLTLKTLTEEQTRVAALRSGEIDGGTFTADTVMTLEGDDSLTILEGLVSIPNVIQFQTADADVPWRDARVRQAINKVIDRELIRQNVFGGKAELTGAIPPGYGDYPLTPEKLAELYANDVDAAKQLMIDAGFEDGFEVELQAIAAPRSYTQNAEIVSEAVKQLNIDAKVVPLEIGTFGDNNGSGAFQWQATGRGMRGDPSGYVIDFRQGTNQNVTWFGDGYNNEEFNTLYDEALAELDQAARVPMYQRMQEIIAEDAANLYLVQPYKFQAVNNRLTGMYVSFTDTNQGLRMACVTDTE
ncbi:MAG: ABC transporter substrate-binding protein [Thermomicrobiales bacterium]|nr:ABC transporter substrate-binding protein [Thermomicrobiales bacterium]MCO5222472.1 ABC transporter substrate-binding protein [Thermomicrobiales bacterium]